MESITVHGKKVEDLVSASPQVILDFFSGLDAAKWEDYKDFNFLLIAEIASARIENSHRSEGISWLFVAIEVYDFLGTNVGTDNEKKHYEHIVMNYIVSGIEEFGELHDTRITS